MYLVIDLKSGEFENAELIKNEDGKTKLFQSWNDAYDEYQKFDEALIVDTTG